MQLAVKLFAASASSRIDRRHAATIIGLKTLSSRCPDAPPMVTAVWLPITCAATWVTASACVGLTLPGMIDDPGSFAGRINSPKPARGPEPIRRMSLAILVSVTAMVLSLPDRLTSASCAARA